MKAKQAIPALQSLAQETRLDVFRLLIRAGDDGMTAGAIASALDVPAPTLSFHLNHLERAGLVERQRDGRAMWYSVNFECVRDLLGFLTNDCCQGHPEICDLKNTCCAPPTRGRRSKYVPR